MIIGKVVGNVWATRKDEKLSGQKFLVVRIIESKSKEKDELFVVSDNVGAGQGDYVLITTGSSARISLGNEEIPVDATIIGIIDSIEVDDE
ncbi:EutN/CcmL family microcompartment protein [Clostridium sporogenes]|uniref:Ethanolamine utilization protein EutN n=2 Tax=Clostridium TaxID=1485 RepID=A0A6M0SXI2_CLOBO|nr:EutN/CcmL family microcompartment protein [Clostridium sporogenes]NFA60216.1 ethanolamine utilization protein EutN [Clostridium botulinum]MDS1002326.1 EutN/CcmL family microcompartment protein [Clostridium sporogenes]NFI72809.1 ethanolamine utilization protein EutN [Clostridium sporogenes]NFL72404.1 ethanolamine utilization protein EutN [Clostridium sporogenes]NFM23417.1 ethanolamine utilization protein EutN [Clostridium sporogenes]